MSELIVHLPTSDEIYDLDTFNLKEASEQINSEIGRLESKQQKIYQQMLWTKKARKLFDLIEQELLQRQTVQNFGDICKNNEQQFFQKLEFFAPLATNWKTAFQKEQLMNPALKENEPISSRSKKPEKLELRDSENKTPTIMGQQTLKRIGTQIDDTTTSSLDRNSRLAQSTSTKSQMQDLEKSSLTDNSDLSYHRYIMSVQNGTVTKQKQDQFSEFVKKTLQHTKITDNRTSNPLESDNQYFIQKYFEQPLSTNDSVASLAPSEKQKQRSLSNQHQNESNDISKRNSQYDHITSKVKEAINYKSEIGTICYVSGQPLYSNRDLIQQKKSPDQAEKQHDIKALINQFQHQKNNRNQFFSKNSNDHSSQYDDTSSCSSSMLTDKQKETDVLIQNKLPRVKSEQKTKINSRFDLIKQVNEEQDEQEKITIQNNEKKLQTISDQINYNQGLKKFVSAQNLDDNQENDGENEFLPQNLKRADADGLENKGGSSLLDKGQQDLIPQLRKNAEIALLNERELSYQKKKLLLIEKKNKTKEYAEQIREVNEKQLAQQIRSQNTSRNDMQRKEESADIQSQSDYQKSDLDQSIQTTPFSKKEKVLPNVQSGWSVQKQLTKEEKINKIFEKEEKIRENNKLKKQRSKTFSSNNQSLQLIEDSINKHSSKLIASIGNANEMKLNEEKRDEPFQQLTPYEFHRQKNKLPLDLEMEQKGLISKKFTNQMNDQIYELPESVSVMQGELEQIQEQIQIDANPDHRNKKDVNSRPSSKQTLKIQYVKQNDDQLSIHKYQDEEIIFKSNGEVIQRKVAIEESSLSNKCEIQSTLQSSLDRRSLDFSSKPQLQIQIPNNIQEANYNHQTLPEKIEDQKFNQKDEIEKSIQQFSPHGNGVIPISEIFGQKSQLQKKKPELNVINFELKRHDAFNEMMVSFYDSDDDQEESILLKKSLEKQQALKRQLDRLKRENEQKNGMRVAFSKKVDQMMKHIIDNMDEDATRPQSHKDNIQSEKLPIIQAKNKEKTQTPLNGYHQSRTDTQLRSILTPTPTKSTRGRDRQGVTVEYPHFDANSMKTISNNVQSVDPAKPVYRIQRSMLVPKENITSKLLMKMMNIISDENLTDYSNTVPTLNHLFSGYYNPLLSTNTNTANKTPFNLLQSMKEMLAMLSNHNSQLEKVDLMLNNVRIALNPLQMTGSEVYYKDDPKKILSYANRVGINMAKFIERQVVLTQRTGSHALAAVGTAFREVESASERNHENDNTKFKQAKYFRVYDIVSRSFMRKYDWNELPHGQNLKTTWNLLWTWSKPEIDMNKLFLFQKVNHFPQNQNMARQDLLQKNIDRISRLGARAAAAFNILPITYVLPQQYCAFSQNFYDDLQREKEYNIWIVKPIAKSRGRGITLVNDISEVVYAEPMIVQKYMKNPLLLDGFKFDMRIYALVTCVKPLEVFVYRQGFARLSTEKFTLDPEKIKDSLIHLTNFAIQKENVDIQKGENFIGGSKISLKMLQRKLAQRGVHWDQIWAQIGQIIIKSMIACQQDMANNPNCFEIFGYDIIIDQDLQCWLLEINSSPSLGREFIIDDLIKQNLIDDAIDLLDPVCFDRTRLCEVLERRIREEQGCKSSINTNNHSQLQLNRDLNYILNGQKIREYGQMPEFMGDFERIAPSELSEKLAQLVNNYKASN